MKHDFLKRQIAPLKTITRGGDCDCIECQKSDAFNQQYANRMKPFDTGTDNLDSVVKPGDWIEALKDIPVYHGQGAASTTKAAKAGSKGQVTRIHGDWIDLANGDFIANKPSNFKVIMSPTKEAIAKILINTNPLAWSVAYSQSILKGKLTDPYTAVKEQAAVVSKVGESIVNFLPNLKWYLIGLVVIVVALTVYKLKS